MVGEQCGNVNQFDKNATKKAMVVRGATIMALYLEGFCAGDGLRPVEGQVLKSERQLVQLLARDTAMWKAT